MLYLIINENGEPEQRWSIDAEKDFAGLRVIGEALKGEDGRPVPSEVLSLDVEGNVVVDAQKVAALANAAAERNRAEEKRNQDRAAALARLKASPDNNIKDLLLALDLL